MAGSLLQCSPLRLQLDVGLQNGLAAQRSLVLLMKKYKSPERHNFGHLLVFNMGGREENTLWGRIEPKSGAGLVFQVTFGALTIFIYIQIQVQIVSVLVFVFKSELANLVAWGMFGTSEVFTINSF